MIRLALACTASDRTRPLLDGRVAVPGCDITFLPGEPEDIFRRAMRDAAFEVTELSMASYILTTARGDAPYIGIPVFPSRAFRHGAAFIRTDRGIATPRDLEGRTIAVPEYQQTAGLWVRGILRDHYGVNTRRIAWRSAGERTPLSLPPGLDVAPLEGGLDAAFAEGRVDAVVGPRVPAAVAAGHPAVGRLFPDTRAEEEAWFRTTGFFPIMHCIAVRSDVAERHPWLPVELFRAFARAKAMAVAELRLGNVLRVSLPWIVPEAERQIALMGGDPWPYGFARNRAELAAMIRYAGEDGLIPAPVPPEALFHPSVLAEEG